MKDLISVIMSIYNEPVNWVKLSIESILSQTYKNIEFILVLDSPNNLELKELLKEYEYIDERVKIIYNTKNEGLVFSLNEALRHCSGNYIARMDADDISHKDRLKMELESMRLDNLDLVGCETETIDENGKIINTHASRYKSKKCIDRWIKFASPIAHPTWLVKKEVYLKLNGYREIKYCEDYDFLLRAHKENFNLGICKGIFFSYRINKLSITNKNHILQSLTTWYLIDHKKTLSSVTQNNIDQYLNEKLSEEKIKDCNEAKKYFDIAKEMSINKNYLKCIYNFAKGYSKSKIYRRYFLEIIKCHILQYVCKKRG